MKYVAYGFLGMLTLLTILMVAPELIGYALFIAAIIIYRNKAKVKGAIGEWLVNQKLEKLDREYTVIHDILLPKEDGTSSQIDHIVTSPYGIFVIETKNYKGWIFGEENSRYWTQTIYRRKTKFLNPIWQNKGHMAALENVLGEEAHPMISIIAFTGEATLKFNKGLQHADVIYGRDLLRTILSHKNGKIASSTLRRINAELEKYVVTDRKVKREMNKAHVEQVKAKIQQSKLKVVRDSGQLVCPKCSKTLIIKNGKFGPFYSCSGFPTCRFKKKLTA